MDDMVAMSCNTFVNTLDRFANLNVKVRLENVVFEVKITYSLHEITGRNKRSGIRNKIRIHNEKHNTLKY